MKEYFDQKSQVGKIFFIGENCLTIFILTNIQFMKGYYLLVKEE